MQKWIILNKYFFDKLIKNFITINITLIIIKINIKIINFIFKYITKKNNN